MSRRLSSRTVGLNRQARQAMAKKMSKLQEQFKWYANESHQNTLYRLKAYCNAIMSELAENKDTKNISGHQIDAFGYGIYFYGKLVAEGYLADKERMDHESRKGKTVPGADPYNKNFYGPSGRQRAKNAIKNHIARKRGYEVLITNAMFYSVIQQENWREFGLTKKYVILSPAISPAWQEMERKYGKYLTYYFII